MKVGYLECFAGISGDMLLGALIDVGVSPAVLNEATVALGLGATLKVTRVDRSGIACTKVDVMVGDTAADKAHAHPHQPGTADGGRSLAMIREQIKQAPLADAIRTMALRTFELLAETEARVHGVPLDEIHFHEVGAVDAIVDIVAGCAGLLSLKVERWFCSPLNVGGGMVQCVHGLFPVPAPATADLLRTVPTYSAHVQKELVTPTGAALVRVLQPSFGPQPAMIVESIGYGAGSRNPEGFTNALRLSVGQASGANAEEDIVTVIETALDDLSPQVLAYTAECALAAGALDVMLTPVVMKKGRPGTLLTVLCEVTRRDELVALVMRETSTLGVRVREEKRFILERRHVLVTTAYGEIRIKVGSSSGGLEQNAAAEYEDCRLAAKAFQVPLKQVQQAASAAYFLRGAK